jgi:hypothetical protein
VTLGQSELFVPQPTKKLIVPAGRNAWWGVDSSTKRVAIGVVSAAGERYGDIAAIPTSEGAARLAAIYGRTVASAKYLQAADLPGVIVVEAAAGFGKRPNPELAYAVGAVLAGLGAACPGVAVQMVIGSKWKLEVCGFGGIKKPKPTAKEEYAVLKWAREHGYGGASWDEADAWAIADYARRTYELEER